MANEIGYTSNAIEYSYPVPRHTDLGEGKYVRHLPMNSITGVTPLCFLCLLRTIFFICKNVTS